MDGTFDKAACYGIDGSRMAPAFIVDLDFAVGRSGAATRCGAANVGGGLCSWSWPLLLLVAGIRG